MTLLVFIDFLSRREATLEGAGGLVHAWVGQIVTFFAYRPPSRPQGSLTPTQPGSVTNPTQGHPGPPWEAPQAECRSLRREPKPPA
jgi:hypothetical protein